MCTEIKLPPTSMLIDEWAEIGVEAGVKDGTAAAAIHAACYLCWQAMERGWLTPTDVLGDRGIVHDLTHPASLDPSWTPEKLRQHAAAVRRIEAMFKR